MNAKFKAVVDGLDTKFRSLMAMTPVQAEDVPTGTPTGGVYLFTENGRAMYVGRTRRNLRDRIREHFGPADDCPFAWRLAREATGRMRTYKKEGSRTALLQNRRFVRAYEAAKVRIAAMHVQYVEETDPLRQALLEIYVTVATGAKHNDFDTH